jgi:hypothetical protein
MVLETAKRSRARLLPSAFIVLIALVAHGCMGGDPTCPSGLAACSDDVCADLSRDGDNCGMCGNKCGGGFECGGGTCNCVGFMVAMCNGQCVNLDSDRNNCGSCGVVCTAAQTCGGVNGCFP